MLGGVRAEQYEFFTSSLRDLIPDEHALARVDRVLDLRWLCSKVADLYCYDNARPGIAPEVAVRLMLAGLLLGIVHDRKLMREAAVNVAIRWFCGFGLTERLADHSSLPRIRQRWGAERFRRIFERSVQACVEAKIATGEAVHIDASLIPADVSWDALARRWVETVEAENEPVEAEPSTNKTGREHIATSMRLTNALGITGRPSFVIRNELIAGYVEQAVLKAAVEQAREADRSPRLHGRQGHQWHRVSGAERLPQLWVC